MNALEWFTTRHLAPAESGMDASQVAEAKELFQKRPELLSWAIGRSATELFNRSHPIGDNLWVRLADALEDDPVALHVEIAGHAATMALQFGAAVQLPAAAWPRDLAPLDELYRYAQERVTEEAA